MPDFTRRAFIAASAGAAAASATPQRTSDAPWYRRTYRWGQTNITERDPTRYDIDFWRKHWKRTSTQGVIINAGGIVAYYPSKYRLHKRAAHLEGRDLYGELAKAAHDDGLVVLARMDSNRAAEEFYKAHPDWFAIDAAGKPYRAADKFITCVSSAYYDEYLPGVISEIIERSKPEGVTDNSWAGLGRDSICYCENCKRRFGKSLPKRPDWHDPAYVDWIEWSYARRIELWELNNRVTRKAGGPHCIWSGMISGSPINQSRTLRDYREICRRADIIMLDHQRRSELGGFQQNTDAGKMIHGVLGWDKLIPESMAMYQADRNSFRVASKPAAEARMWMVAGFAGGIQPWWHHVGAFHEDRRMYATAEPVMRWHAENDQYLVNREPLAAVGVVWSRRNTDYYGRDHAEELVELPYRGIVQALVRARIPYIPVNADDIDRDGSKLTALILPDVAVLSDEQCASVFRFVTRGGGLLATGLSSAFDLRGRPRNDFALGDLFGAHTSRESISAGRKNALGSRHSYLRISRDLKGDPLFKGFEETAILPFGGALEPLRVGRNRTVPLTFVPAFPVYPPETAWMREPQTDIPGLVLTDGQARVAYLPADIDRRLAKDNLPDHADLLANLMRWVSRNGSPLEVEGRGLIDCNLYQQPGRVILHVVNLSNSGRPPVDELLPVGPFKVRVKAPGAGNVRLLVADGTVAGNAEGDWFSFEIPSIVDHEVVVVS